jgi:phosphatidylserine decarboxylase
MLLFYSGADRLIPMLTKEDGRCGVKMLREPRLSRDVRDGDGQPEFSAGPRAIQRLSWLPRRVRDMSRLGAHHGRRSAFARVALRTRDVHRFDHAANWVAKVRNVSGQFESALGLAGMALHNNRLRIPKAGSKDLETY